MITMYRTGSPRRGQGLIEFALILPVFLAMVFGTVELGWLVYSNHTLSNATREGARYAMVNGEMSGSIASSGEVGQVVNDNASGLSGSITTAVNFSGSAEPGDEVTVSTTYQYQPIVGAFLGIGSIPLSSSSTVIVQY